MADIPADADVPRPPREGAGVLPHAASAPPSAQPWPGTATAYYSLGLVTVGLLFSLLDRQVLVLMIGPVKADLGISDTQVSLLVGFAFVSMYAVLGIPIARLADTKNRRNIVAAGMAFWSVMTMFCGLAQNYWQLFVARMGVGAGESSFSPASYSILTDSFPREKLAKALGIFNIGSNAGGGLALIIGGGVLALLSDVPEIVVPGIGVMRPWQWAFIIVALPGLLWALLIRTTLKEPARRGLMLRAGEKQKSLPIGQVFKYMFDDWKCYGPIFLAMALKALLSVGTAQWGAEFFARTYGWARADYGLRYGLILVVIAPIGLILGGLLSERWMKKGMWDCNMRIVLLASMIILPSSIIYPLLPNAWMAMGLMAFNFFIATLGIGPGNAALQLITPNQMRGQVNALFLFVLNVVGFGIGPTFVALFTDFLFQDESQLKYSMSLCAAILSPLAIFVTWYGVAPYGRSLKRASEQFA